MLPNIYVVTDPNMIGIFAQNGFKIIFIGDCTNQQLISAVNGIPASIFNPPFDAVVANVDGDYEKFSNLYLQYLSTNPDVNDFIITMIQASFIQNIGLILYLDLNEFNMYFNILQLYLSNNYGLIVGNQQLGIRCQMNNNAFQNLLQTMYIEDRIGVEFYLKMNELMYSDIIMQKLILDLGLQYLNSKNLSNEQYYQIFDDIKLGIIDNGCYIKQPFIKIYC